MENILYVLGIILLIILIILALKCIKLINNVNNSIIDIQQKLASIDFIFQYINQITDFIENIPIYIKSFIDRIFKRKDWFYG